MKRMRHILHYISVVSLIALTGCNILSNKEKRSELKINDIQTIGSHNSYKQAIEPSLLQILQKETSRSFEDLQYAHIPISQQLEDYKLRNLEIDVVYDPQGGRYANPLGMSILRQLSIDPLQYDPDGLMKKPGFKVMHVPDIDFRSNCLTLTNCLKEIKNWSDTHPNHLPILITMNTKSEQIDKPGFVKLLPFSKIALDSLDKEILSVIPKNRIIKPDDIRGNFNTLETAVLKNKWPKLDDARGKFIFVIDEFGEKRKNYLEGHSSLRGRLMFIASGPGNPEAAIMIVNDPIKNQEKIKKLVKAGYLVRTRADADTKEARKGDYTRFKAALSSGAHYISTDYYMADKNLETGYKIGFSDKKVARCNPVTIPKGCNDKILE